MKSILILVLSDLRTDARVRRQVEALQYEYKVTVVCFAGNATSDYELITIRPTKLTFFRKAIASLFLVLRLYRIAHGILHDYGHIIKQLRHLEFDLIIANDVETLPFAFSFGARQKVLFDAHEYAPRHFEDKRVWRIFFQPFNTWLCKKYIPLTAGMMTVGEGLANEYKKHFGVQPVVVFNANRYSNATPSPTGSTIRLVHHGIATPSRQLELLIDMMKDLDERFTLDMILLVPGFANHQTRHYIDELKTKAAGDKRITILPPIKSEALVQAINAYDVGVFLLPPVNFNYANTLPNKLFDFIQARLAIAIGPTPEMADIVNRYDIGVVSDDFHPASLAKKLNNLVPAEIMVFKKNTDAAARELNAEKNAVTIRGLVSQIVDQAPRAVR